MYFINHCVQLILECTKYKLNPKLESFNIYYYNQDAEMSQYITLVKQMFDIQIGIQVSFLLFILNIYFVRRY